MSLAVVVKDASGLRTIDEHNLPLSIGTVSDSDVRIPGPVAGGQIAQIGLLDGRAFIQVPGQGEVSVNGTVVTSTCWLADGDELSVAGVHFNCQLSSAALTISMDEQAFQFATAPPEIAPNSERDATTITPVILERTRRPELNPVRHSRRLYVLYGFFAVLLLAALYMFAAVSVVIKVEQGNGQIALPGSWLTPGGDGRYILWPGEYTVAINAPGYYPFTETISVMSGERAEFLFKLSELPGRLSVTTVPETAGELWLDGERVDELPVSELSLEQGGYELRIRAPRYLEHVAAVSIAGRDQLQTVVVELVPGWADVAVSTVPAGAEVLVDDLVLGVTPTTVELLAGTQQVVFRKEGYKTERRTINVVAGKADELPLVSLDAAGGLLQLSSNPSGAAVTVENEYAGLTPMELEVAKGGSYAIRLNKAGYQIATHTVAVPDGTPVKVAVTLEPKKGMVDVTVTPADAEIYVNGKRMGTGDRELELLALPQLLEARRQGYVSWTKQITPQPGLPQRFAIKLLTPQQSVLAAIPKTIETFQGQLLRLVEPGEFQLGAPRREQGRRPNEVQRSVKLTRLFYIAVQEVTNREFREFKPRHTSGAEKYRELAADNHPAVMMSWEEAAAYCNWLSVKEGLPPAYKKEQGRYALIKPANEGYRLPTEAEWAWVARYNAGGGAMKYPWGESMPPSVDAGNFADSYAMDVVSNTIGNYTDGYPVTSPVGSFPPSPLGIYDLGGNVAEWVNDRYTVTASNGQQLLDPLGPVNGQYHVIRGSSWRQASISELRLAYRDFGDRGRLDVGFRIARYAAPAE